MAETMQALKWQAGLVVLALGRGRWRLAWVGGLRMLAGMAALAVWFGLWSGQCLRRRAGRWLLRAVRRGIL